MLEQFSSQLKTSAHLSEAQVREAVDELVNEEVEPEKKADFLCHLALKGETVDEIAWFAKALREKAIEPPIKRNGQEILDVCGTGGDRLNTFNISTTVALVCAAAGVAVAKHGNRAITSQAGSADVLEELGIRIDMSPSAAAESLQEKNFAFFFAPNYHPAFRFIGPARKLCASRGQRTIFNFLGPLLNPARPTAQLVGVPRPELCEPMARVLQALGARRGMVVSGKVQSEGEKGVASNPEPQELYLDELSTLGENFIAEFYHERGFSASTVGLESFQLQPTSLEDLMGAGRERNAQIIRQLVRGEDRGPKRDAVLLNSAAGLLVASRAPNLSAGWEMAAEVIDSGKASRKLEELCAG